MLVLVLWDERVLVSDSDDGEVGEGDGGSRELEKRVLWFGSFFGEGRFEHFPLWPLGMTVRA